MNNILLDEANGCLVCKNPRCKVNCRIDTPTSDIITLYKEGNLKEAGEILFNNNPLSAVCSLVCIHKEHFASGDVVTGAKTVVEAVFQAKIFAGTIEEYCKNN